MAVQAEVEGLAFGHYNVITRCDILRQVEIFLGKTSEEVFVNSSRTVPGCPGGRVGDVRASFMVAGRAAANEVVGMARRFSSHAGRAQQGTQAQRYTYDPFLPRHFVTRSSPRFISLRYTEGCGVYTPGLVVMGVWGYGFPRALRALGMTTQRGLGGCRGVPRLRARRGDAPQGYLLRGVGIAPYGRSIEGCVPY